jgi:hypothetical protein
MAAAATGVVSVRETSAVAVAVALDLRRGPPVEMMALRVSVVAAGGPDGESGRGE